MPENFDITVSDLETLPGADLDDGDRILISRPGAFDKTVTWGAVKEELGVGVDLTALQNEVAGKAAAIHQHIPTDIQGRGQPNGFATLDATGKIPILQIPDGIGGGSGSVGGIEDVPGLQDALDGKAALSHTQAISTITGLQPALDGKAAAVHGHVIADVSGLQTALDARVLTSSVGQASGVASLGSDGKVPPSQIPSLAIGDTFVVGSEAAMLALVAQQGDVARRTDTGQTFILQTEPATTLANWVQISATAAVSTVNGETGDVTLTITDIPGLQTAIDSKAATAHVHNATEITSGVMSTARLGTGTPTATNFLRGDGAWAGPAISQVTGLQTALDGKLATAANTASQGLVLTATGASAWEWKAPSGGGGTPVDANGHPVINGVAAVGAIDWRGGIEVVSGVPTLTGSTSAYRSNSRRLYVTVGTPRLHFTADAAGLLAEGLIKNYCANNSTITGWVGTSATVAAATGVTTPGGTAGGVQVGSSLAGGYAQQTVVTTPTEGAGNYAVSGFFRAGSASVITLWLTGDNGATFSRCAFDLTTGIATPDNGAIVPSGVRVERYPNGWWYVGFVAALASVANTRVRVYPGGLSGAVGTVVFWGVQIAPAAYVPQLSGPTTTGLVQKAIDTRSSALTTPITPSDAGSVYLELYPGAAIDGCLVALGSTTGSKPRLEIRRTASGDGGLIRAFNAAGTQVFSQSITLTTGLTRIGVASGSDSTVIAVNGTTFTVAASLDWLAMNRIAVGTDIDLLNAPAGALFLRLLIYPAALSLDSLAALSLGGSIGGGGSGGGSGGGGVTLPINISDVSGLTAALDAKLDDSQLAQPSGVASLDPSGFVPVAQLPVATTSTNGALSAADKTKLDTVATGATANATDAALRDRTTHTGTQAIATVTGLQPALDGKANTAHVHAAADVTSGVFTTARLGTGTPSAANYLKGDGSWSAIAQSDVTGLVTSLAGKSDTGHTHAAADVTSGTFATARLGSGTANNTAYLRGDSTWQALNVASVSGLQAALDAKSALVHTHVIADVTGLQAALDARVLTSALGASGGVATLDGTGKIPSAQLPALAITEVFTVASQAAMLALLAQQGDLARRTDLSRTFILTASDPTVLSNWVEWLIPNDAVTSVAGKTGAVTLAIADTVGLQAALDGKANTTHTHAAADVTSGTFAAARLGSGAADTGAYLRGDSSWQVLNVSAVSGLQAALDGKAATTHTHAAADITSGILATARLGSGTPSSANYLRGDGAWSGIVQSDVAGLVTALAGKIDTTARGAASGVASLDASTLVPAAQIPTLDLTKLSSSGATSGQVVSFNGSAVVWASPAGGNLTWTARTTNATLSANENCLANSGVTQLTLPTSVAGSHEIVNNTTSVIELLRGGTATLSGISAATNAAFSGSTSIRIRPGTRVSVIASGANWIVQNATNPTVLAYGGSPPATGAAPPLTGLFYHLGTNLGTGAWANPTGGALLTAAASAIEAGSLANATNRSNDQSFTGNTANSWIGWETTRPFTPTGFLFQTPNGSAGYPRAFELRGSNDVGGAAFTSTTPVGNWTQIQSWTGQTQITGTSAWFYFAVTNAIPCRRFAFRMTGLSSTSTNYLEFGEFEFFGFLD